MLEFSNITEDNVIDISKYFSRQRFRTCDYTLIAVYMWKDYFQSKYAVYNDNLIIRNLIRNTDICKKSARYSFSFPVGNSSIDATLNEINNYAAHIEPASSGSPLVFDSVPTAALEILKTHFGEIEPLCSDDWSDYLYAKDDIVYLRGKKFAGQRNHINKLLNERGIVNYVPIDKSNIHRVKDFYKSITVGHEISADLIYTVDFSSYESEMASRVLDRFFDFNLLGGFIEADGEIISFAVGEKIGDTLFVHIEKGNRSINGSYAMINREFAAHNATQEIKFINREEDLGVPGLRKAKLSYHPIELLKKHYVFIW